MTKQRTAGEAMLAKAITERERWELALATAQADSATAAAIVPDSLDDLDRVGERTVAAHGRAEAARRGLSRAREVEAGARRDLLRRIADDVATDRSVVEREADALSRKIEPLLRSLRDLDGVDYGPTPIATLADGTTVLASDASLAQHESYTVQRSRREQLARRSSELVLREAMLRYVAEHGATPPNGRALLGAEPIRNEDTLARIGLGGPFGFDQLASPDEARDYLTWMERGALEAVANR